MSVVWWFCSFTLCCVYIYMYSICMCIQVWCVDEHTHLPLLFLSTYTFTYTCSCSLEPECWLLLINIHLTSVIPCAFSGCILNCQLNNTSIVRSDWVQSNIVMCAADDHDDGMMMIMMMAWWSWWWWLPAVFLAERDSERFALYAKKAALDERAAELKAQLKVCTVLGPAAFVAHCCFVDPFHLFWGCIGHPATSTHLLLVDSVLLHLQLSIHPFVPSVKWCVEVEARHEIYRPCCSP